MGPIATRHRNVPSRPSAGDSPWCLAASLLLAVAQPLTSGLFDEQGSFDVFFSLLIVAVLLLVFEEREHRRIAIVTRSGRLSRHLGGPTAVGGLAGRRAPRRNTPACGRASLRSPCMGFSVQSSRKQASGDAIFGAVCGYLLLGIIWSLLYSAVETASPGSFIAMPPSARRTMWLLCDLDRGDAQLLQLHYLGHRGIWRRDADRRPWPEHWPGWKPLPVSFTLQSWWRDL